MDLTRTFRILLACLCLGAPVGARAAPGDWVSQVKPLPPPADGQGLPLEVPPPAGPAAHEAWAGNAGQRMVYNVTQPQLIAVGSEAGNACGKACSAIILVPGGGVDFLSIDTEG